MENRFTPLVKLKKSAMQKSEEVLKKANQNLHNASKALKESYKVIENIKSPLSGDMGKFLASRMLVSSARDVINHNKEWVEFAKIQLNQAKEKLKFDMIEYEKFKHLELQEFKKEIDKLKKQEAKDLDEVALMIYSTKVES